MFTKCLLLHFAFKSIYKDAKLEEYVNNTCKNIPTFIKDKLKRQAASLSFPELKTDPNDQVLARPVLNSDTLGLTEGVVDDGTRLFEYRGTTDQQNNLSQISFASSRNQSQLHLEPQHHPATPPRRNSRILTAFTSPTKAFDQMLSSADIFENDDVPQSPKRQRKGLGNTPRTPSQASLSNKKPKKNTPTPRSPLAEFHSENALQSAQFSPRRLSVFAESTNVVYKSLEHRQSTPRRSATKEPQTDDIAVPDSEMDEQDSPLKNKESPTVDLHISSSIAMSDAIDRPEHMIKRKAAIPIVRPDLKKFKGELSSETVLLSFEMTSDAQEAVEKAEIQSSFNEDLESEESSFVFIEHTEVPQNEEIPLGPSKLTKTPPQTKSKAPTQTPRRSRRIKSKSDLNSMASHASTVADVAPKEAPKSRRKGNQKSVPNMADLKAQVNKLVGEPPLKKIKIDGKSRSTSRATDLGTMATRSRSSSKVTDLGSDRPATPRARKTPSRSTSRVASTRKKK